MSSICGFDMVLSIKETSIQSQLAILYELPLGQKLLPTLDENGNPTGATPEQRYLIDHDIKLRSPSPQGERILDGHIAVPVVHLTPGTTQQASLSFTFCKDSDLVNASSSTFTYYPSDQKKVLTLDGWTMSWVCDITSRQIQNVMEELINPSKLPVDKHPAVLEPSVQKSLEKLALSSKDLMISSLFCVLESRTLASSFKLHDAQGRDVDPAAVQELKEMMMGHIDALGSQASPGIPTTQNPFVLGYGVVQQPGAIQAASHPPPTSFIPREFHLAVTPAQGQNPAMLNYLIKTHRDPGELDLEEPVDLEGLNHKLQTWLQSAGGFTGVIGFSRQLVQGHLVSKMLARSFYDAIDSESVLAADFLGYGKTSNYTCDVGSIGIPTGPRTWSIRENFNVGFHRHENSWFFNLETDHGEQTIKGHREVIATMASDPASSRPDGSHRLFLTFDITLFYHFTTYYRGSAMSQNEDGNVSLKYRIVLIVNTGEDGRWQFDRGESVLPEIIDGKLNLREEKADDRLGSFAWGSSSSTVQSTGMDGIPSFSFSGVVDHLPDLQALSDGQMQKIMKALNEGMPTMNNMLFMPAGDVYAFNGLDSTEDGHVVARVKYKTRTTGKRV